MYKLRAELRRKFERRIKLKTKIEMAKITIELSDLRNLLDEQIKLTANNLKSSSYLYNKESTEGNAKSLPINEERFFEVAGSTKYAKDYLILEKYLG